MCVKWEPSVHDQAVACSGWLYPSSWRASLLAGRSRQLRGLRLERSKNPRNESLRMCVYVSVQWLEQWKQSCTFMCVCVCLCVHVQGCYLYIHVLYRTKLITVKQIAWFLPYQDYIQWAVCWLWIITVKVWISTIFTDKNCIMKSILCFQYKEIPFCVSVNVCLSHSYRCLCFL